jgi:lysyl-tRNA synthetase class 2
MLSPQGLRQRSCLLQAVRNFFLSRSYLEVDTPVRLPVLIPEAEIIPIQSEDRLLQTSPELCMKRLLAHGSSQLFQICHCFRRGEQGRLHQEEFTMLEWYHTGWSYLELMDECEEMVLAAAGELLNREDTEQGMSLIRDGEKISLAVPWQRMTVAEAFSIYAGITAAEAADRGLFDQLLVERVEPHLGRQRPLFLYDYPLSLASLARPKREQPYAERFELYIGGVELANGFSELTDPAVQRQRFRLEINRAAAGGRRCIMPEKFLHDLAAVPDCAGIALGLDRLLMLFCNAESMDQVLPFADNDL